MERNEDQDVASLKAKVQRYGPPTRYCNVLFFGPRGAGKSSYLNTVHSACVGYVTERAITYPSAEHVTTTLQSYNLIENDRIKIWDCMGWDSANWEDGKISAVLDGHVPINGSVDLREPINSRMRHWIAAPRDSDRVHALVVVITEATVTSTDSMGVVASWLRLARQRGMTPLVLVSRADLINPNSRDYRRIQRSEEYQAISRRIVSLGEINGNSILPIVNYSEQQKNDDEIDSMSLSALVYVLQKADEYYDRAGYSYDKGRTRIHAKPGLNISNMGKCLLIIILAYALWFTITRPKK